MIGDPNEDPLRGTVPDPDDYHEPQKIEWGKISFGVTRTCPHCHQEYEDNGYAGHILAVVSTEGEYRTCLTILMRALHQQFPGLFQFTEKAKP